jgi:hypothetical protein
LIITLVFEKNATFSQKIVKIAESCDHNIDPLFVAKLNSHVVQQKRRKTRLTHAPVYKGELGRYFEPTKAQRPPEHFSPHKHSTPYFRVLILREE